MTRNNHAVSRLVVAIGLGISLTGCEYDIGAPKPTGPGSFHPLFYISSAGTTHNAALAAVLTALDAAQGNKTDAQIDAIIRDALNGYFSITMSDPQWNEGSAAATLAHNENRPVWTNYVGSQAAAYLDDITDLLETEGIDASAVNSALSSMESSAVSALSGSDKTTVLNAISVAGDVSRNQLKFRVAPQGETLRLRLGWTV